MAEWNGWEKQLLAALGLKASAGSVRFLAEWHSYEQSGATNNPLNTTQAGFGGKPFNAAGVESYPTRAEGIAATKATLQNGDYPHILDALKSGDPYLVAEPFAVATYLGIWGSHNFAAAYYKEVTGDTLPASHDRITPIPQPQDGSTPDRQINAAWTALTRTLAVTVHHNNVRVAQARARIERAVR